MHDADSAIPECCSARRIKDRYKASSCGRTTSIIRETQVFGSPRIGSLEAGLPRLAQDLWGFVDLQTTAGARWQGRWVDSVASSLEALVPVEDLVRSSSRKQRYFFVVSLVRRLSDEGQALSLPDKGSTSPTSE
jgi:hypothetical protein